MESVRVANCEADRSVATQRAVHVGLVSRCWTQLELTNARPATTHTVPNNRFVTAVNEPVRYAEIVE